MRSLHVSHVNTPYDSYVKLAARRLPRSHKSYNLSSSSYVLSLNPPLGFFFSTQYSTGVSRSCIQNAGGSALRHHAYPHPQPDVAFESYFSSLFPPP